MDETQYKFLGTYIALVEGEIVASGRSQLEIFNFAKKNYPHKLITLSYIPTKREVTDFFLSPFSK